jgi:hypothetical protein
MKTLRWATAALLLGALFAGTALAQTSIQQPASVQPTAYQSDEFGYAVADQGGPATSPSNLPPAPPEKKPGPSAALTTTGSAEEAKADEPAADEEKPFKLFQSQWLDCHHIDIRGYVDVGFTWNPDNPANRENGPDGYNDRSNEGDLNQLYLITERVTKTDGCGIDWGGRVDLLYGTDRRFNQVNTGTRFDSLWNLDQPYYGLDMPQLYGDLAVNNAIFRIGHILAPCGYENVMPTENFFYSHTYSFLYLMPTTLTGGEGIYKINDRWTVNGGVDTGWNNFDTVNQKANLFGGFTWNSEDGKTTLGIEGFVGNQQTIGVPSTRSMVCGDFTQKIGDKWLYALEVNDATETNEAGGGNTASWYSFVNYFFYTINDCWSAGFRYEYASDEDGVVVTEASGLTPANSYTFSPVGGAHYNDVAAGLNWKPNKTVTVRSEVRWDWATTAPGVAPVFDDRTKNTQFLWGTDLIVRF